VKLRTTTPLFVPLALLAGCTGASDGAGRWQPGPGVTWQWQLSGRVDTSVRASVYDIDGFDQSRAPVGTLHGKGRKAICYRDSFAVSRRSRRG
jgi:hypothetical protein